MNSLDYAKMCCEEKIRECPSAELPPYPKLFNYTAGVFLHGTEELYNICHYEKYNAYIKKWIRNHVDKNGNISVLNEGVLDHIQPCNLLLTYCEKGIDEKGFRIAVDNAAKRLKCWRCNQYGGFWHMERFPNQMWLDSVYMGQFFGVRYGLFTKDNEFLEIAEKQMTLIWEHARDKQTGLLYHAWDASGEAVWANKETGCSSEFWGRALGWYFSTTALLNEILPENVSLKGKMQKYGKMIAESLLNFQDKNTGMWYQLVNRVGEKDNWIETSCSCLYIFAMCKLIRCGVLTDQRFVDAVKRGYKGIIKNYVLIDNGRFHLKNICVGTGVGDHTFYVNRPKEENNLHGMGAFLLMCTEYYKLFNE